MPDTNQIANTKYTVLPLLSVLGMYLHSDRLGTSGQNPMAGMKYLNSGGKHLPSGLGGSGRYPIGIIARYRKNSEVRPPPLSFHTKIGCNGGKIRGLLVFFAVHA